MTPEEKKYLRDIEQAIVNIDIHLKHRKEFEQFDTNITRKRAVGLLISTGNC